MIRLAVVLLMIEKCFQINTTLCDGSYRTGSCCAGFQYDSTKETCVQCPKGYFGKSCKDPCPYPRFGDFCQDFCTCTKNNCDEVKGCAQQISTQTGKTFRNIILRTDRTTSSFLSGSLGYNDIQTMSSSSIQKVTHRYNDTKLSTSIIHENNAAPIRLSVIILVCLSAIILILYVASYARNHTDDIKTFVFCNQKTNMITYSCRNVDCDV